MTDLEQLSLEVSKIVERVNKEKDEKWRRGEYFNIFDVLGVSTSEVRTHTAFLAEILNPTGSHGMGVLPLNTFISIINSLHSIDFDAETAIVKREFSIGPIDENYDTGGQIDLCIESKDSAIIIENKINAKDQKKQLLRYYRYAKSHYRDFVLLYLSLDGHSPSDDSTNDEKDSLQINRQYYCISYRDYILPLLSLCQKESFDRPLFRETLIQYKNLINELTNISMDTTSAKELVELMFKHPDIAAAIIEKRDDFLAKAVNECFLPRVKTIAQKYGLKVSVDESFYTRKINSGINLFKDEWSQIRIRIECMSSWWCNLFLGVVYQDNATVKSRICKSFNCLESGNDWWIGGWKYLNPRNFDYSSAPTLIHTPIDEGIYSQIDTLIKSILEEIDSRGKNFFY